jgi:hypothetical protein
MVSSSFIRPLRRLWQMSWRERIWLVRAWIALPVVQWRLRRLGYLRTREKMEVPVASARTVNDPEAARLASIVALAAQRHVVRLQCLPRSLWTWRQLRTLGCPCELRLGVTRSQSPEFEAHAWVELDGQPLHENQSLERGGSHVPFTAVSKSEQS